MPCEIPLIRNPAKETLKSGGAVVVFNVFEALRPSVVRIVAQLGYDLLLVETEHIQHNPETLTHFLVMARDNGLSPTVTIPGVDRANVARLLDAGALGFCLCHAETVAQVEELVRWMKYPPDGERALAHGPNADYRIQSSEGSKHAHILAICTLCMPCRDSVGASYWLPSRTWADRPIRCDQGFTCPNIAC